MSNQFNELSNAIADAVDRVAPSVVQVSSHRRPVAGVIFDRGLVAVPARAISDDEAIVRRPDGSTVEAEVLGHAMGSGLAVVRSSALDLPAAVPAAEPRIGALAIAVGRTWSGAPISSVTNVAVVGGPLRTGRSSQLERVIRIAQAPHGAFTGGALIDGEGQLLGLITGAEIRGTTVVIPAAAAWAAARDVVSHGGTRQGYLGVSTLPVHLASQQRSAGDDARGLLVTAVADGSPADAAGLLVGDILVQFNGEAIDEPETLLTRLRGTSLGAHVPLAVQRAGQRIDVTVTVGERPRRRG